MKYRGLKQIRDRQLHDVEYVPKSRGEGITIHLYFEPGTLRLVLSVYRKTMQRQATDVRRLGESDAWTLLEERFSDFKTAGGLPPPSHWDVC